MTGGPAARVIVIAAAAALALGGCERLGLGDSKRPATARAFPAPDRPVARTVSNAWSTEAARDEVNEAAAMMTAAGVAPGMTVADIGAGEGYYTVRLAARVGASGRVLAQDISRAAIDRLADRVTRERLDNVSLKLGAEDDPRLPAASFDRVFMVRMYHEVAEPYAFLWRLHPALRPGGEVVVVDANRPVAAHGTPLRLLICEFEATGFSLLEFRSVPDVQGYLARFKALEQRPEPGAIKRCKNP